jgi:hypothetical protein
MRKWRAENPEEAKARHQKYKRAGQGKAANRSWHRFARGAAIMRGKGEKSLALIKAIKEILEEIQPASVRAVSAVRPETHQEHVEE